MSKQDDIKQDIRKYSALEATAKSDGGKILLDSLKKDIVSAVDELGTKYKTIPHIELVSICAKLSERLTILRIFNRASKLKKMAAEELAFLIEQGE